jgi:uncharacterized protein (DUF433 family)
VDELQEIAPGIVLDRKTGRAKPLVKGTKVRVEDVVNRLAEGQTYETLTKECSLSLEGIQAAVGYASDIVAGEPDSRHGDVEELSPGVTRDLRVRFGKPVIKGTRVDVATVLGSVSAGDSLDEVAKGYGLKPEQVRAAFAYAYGLLSRETVSAR